jgi:hypothetical protein
MQFKHTKHKSETRFILAAARVKLFFTKKEQNFLPSRMSQDAEKFDVRVDKCVLCDTKRYIQTKKSSQTNSGKIPEPSDPKSHCLRDLRAGLKFEVCLD